MFVGSGENRQKCVFNDKILLQLLLTIDKNIIDDSKQIKEQLVAKCKSIRSNTEFR